MRFQLCSRQESLKYNFNNKVACDLLIKSEVLEQSRVPADSLGFQPFQSGYIYPQGVL